MNKKISALTLLEYRSFELDRRRRMILNVLDFHRASKNVPQDLLPKLKEALLNTDENLDWVHRIINKIK